MIVAIGHLASVDRQSGRGHHTAAICVAPPPLDHLLREPVSRQSARSSTRGPRRAEAPGLRSAADPGRTSSEVLKGSVTSRCRYRSSDQERQLVSRSSPRRGVEMVAVSWRWRSVQGDGGHPCHPVRLVLERYLGGGYGDWGRYRMLLLLITTRVAELGGSGTLDQRPRHIRYQNCRRPGQERENRRTTRLRRVLPPAAASSAPERVPPSPLRGSKNSMIPAPVRSVPKTRTVGALRLPTSMRRACDRFNPLVGMVP